MVVKVAMIAHHPEKGEAIDGGVQAVTSYLVRAMANMPEIDLHVLSFQQGIDRVLKTPESDYVRYSVPLAKFGTLTGFKKDQAILNSCLASIRPDIVHSQGGGHHGILAKRSGFPSVVTIHGIHKMEARHLPGLKRQIRAYIEGWIGEQVYIRHASHTILISQYVADHYANKLSGKRYLIPNPVDPRFFELARRENPNKVLFAGRLYALKGVKVLLRAASRISTDIPLQVVLAGSLADRKYVAELKAEATDLGLSDVVQFRGILQTDELLNELSESACLVLPSYQETAPMVIQEAMAAGVPVIASNICGIPYQVCEQRTGFLVPPGDPEALAHRLNTLLSDKTMRKQFGAAGRSKAKNEYSAKTIAERTLGVYREVLEQRDVR